MSKKNNTTVNKHNAIREMIEIFDLFPNVPISQHLIALLRPAKEAYNWSDEKLTEEIIKYKYALENDSEDEDF